MVRFSSVVISYFVMGVLMYGAGLTDPGSLGIVDLFFTVENGTVTPSDQPSGWLGGMGNSLQDVGAELIGPALVIWEAISGLAGALFWPVVVLMSVDAPVEVVLLLGGTPTVAFFMGIIRIVKTSI